LSLISSEEDSQTFHVNFASGESYKLRAANVRDRQVWVDRIRAVAHRHESAMARDNAPPIIHKEFLGMLFFVCDFAKDFKSLDYLVLGFPCLSLLSFLFLDFYVLRDPINSNLLALRLRKSFTLPRVL